MTVVQVDPRAISAWLISVTIVEYPCVTLGVVPDARLKFREELVVNFDVTFRGSAHHDTLAFLLPLLVVVDGSGCRTAENLELQLEGRVVGMDIQVRLNENLLLRVFTFFLTLILLQVLILSHEAASDHVHDDVRLSNVDQHVIFELNWLLLAHKDTIADTEVLNCVLILSEVIRDLKVSTPMLL